MNIVISGHAWASSVISRSPAHAFPRSPADVNSIVPGRRGLACSLTVAGSRRRLWRLGGEQRTKWDGHHRCEGMNSHGHTQSSGPKRSGRLKSDGWCNPSGAPRRHDGADDSGDKEQDGDTNVGQAVER
jgi:hypothetical protein